MSSMSDDVVFVDTNVLVYLLDQGEPGKRAIAKEIFRQYQRIWLSTQGRSGVGPRQPTDIID
jgi:predicted nucleic acid-binding protein